MTTKYAFAGILLSIVTVLVKGDVQQGAVTILGDTFTVSVADTYTQQSIGLAKYDSPDEIGADGMLFTFDEEASRTFWMRGMAFPIDIIWIKDGKVVKVSANVEPPKKGDEPAAVDSNPLVVDMVLELPAGEALKHGIVPGVPAAVSLDGTVVTW